jgi:hypothetical protein
LGFEVTARIGPLDTALNTPVPSAAKTGGGVEETERPEGGVGVWGHGLNAGGLYEVAGLPKLGLGYNDAHLK